MAIIDLGFDRAAPPETGARRPRPRWTTGRSPGARWLRAAVAGLVAAATVTSASIIPGPVPAYASVPLDPDSGFQMINDSIYTVGSVRNGTVVAAYATAGGYRWGLGLGSAPDFVTVAEAGPVTLVQFGLSRPGVVVVDRLTGIRRWQRIGVVRYTSGDRVLLTATTGRVTRLSWCDAGTGDTLWTRDVASDAVLTIGPPVGPAATSADRIAGDAAVAGVAHLYVVTPDGHVRDLRLADEPAERDAALATPARPSPAVVAVRDRLVVVGLGRSLAQMQAYDTAQFRPVWTGGFSGGGIGAPTLTVAPCGAALCELAGDDVHGLSLDTGALTWDVPHAIVQSAGGWLVVTPGATDLTDPLDPGEPAAGTGARVLDATTGATLLTVHGWRLSWASAEFGAVFVRGVGGSGRSQVAALAPGAARPELRTVGEADGLTGECRRTGGYVGCRAGHRLTVWRV